MRLIETKATTTTTTTTTNTSTTTIVYQHYYTHYLNRLEEPIEMYVGLTPLYDHVLRPTTVTDVFLVDLHEIYVTF